jgi:hypothetical protein
MNTKYYLLFITILLTPFTLIAQINEREQLSQLNWELDNKPYWDISFDYNKLSSVPDSVKTKVLNAIEQKVTPKSLHTFFRRLGITHNDSITCVKLQAQSKSSIERCRDSLLHKSIEYYSTNYKPQVSKDLILACGKWNITECIPIFLEYKKEKKSHEPETTMALAKLGVDSCRNRLIKECTLKDVLKNKPFSTTNKDQIYYFISDDFLETSIDYMERFYFIGMYLEDINPLINMIDLLDIEGRVPFQDFDFIYMDTYLLGELSFKFKDHPKYDEWYSLVVKYKKEEKKDHDNRYYLTRKLKEEIKLELKKWISNNVKFTKN